MTGWRTVRLWGQDLVEFNDGPLIIHLNGYGLEMRIRHWEEKGIDTKDEREALVALEAACETSERLKGEGIPEIEVFKIMNSNDQCGAQDFKSQERESTKR